MIQVPDPHTLSGEEIAELNKKLSTMRHNVNNQLALMVAAAELIRRKPEAAERFAETLNQQPEKISAEIRRFSEELEIALGVKPRPVAPL
jgi:hypothetical protein